MIAFTSQRPGLHRSRGSFSHSLALSFPPGIRCFDSRSCGSSILILILILIFVLTCSFAFAPLSFVTLAFVTLTFATPLIPFSLSLAFAFFQIVLLLYAGGRLRRLLRLGHRSCNCFFRPSYNR